MVTWFSVWQALSDILIPDVAPGKSDWFSDARDRKDVLEFGSRHTAWRAATSHGDRGSDRRVDRFGFLARGVFGRSALLPQSSRQRRSRFCVSPFSTA